MSATTHRVGLTQAPATISRAGKDAYFAQVDGFGKSRMRWAYGVAGIAWMVAIGAGAVAGAEAFAIARLALRPLPDPVVLRVDDATGLVDRVYDVQGGEMAASEAEARHWLWQFVSAAESYSNATARHDFDVVSLMSSPSVQAWQADRVKGSNPRSPQVILGRDGQSVLNWESTTFINKGLAQVRYMQTDRKGDNVLAARHMVATVGFTFAKGPVSGAALNVNPRGFLVTSYSVDQEGAR